MLKRIDIMVDLETLGKGSENPIIEFSAVAFDLISGEIVSKLFMPIKLEDMLFVDPDTLVWWMKTNKDLLATIILNGAKDGITERVALNLFSAWISDLCGEHGVPADRVYLWGNGILFDNRFIKDRMARYNIPYPIYYRNDRDVRTLVDTYADLIGSTYAELKAQRDPKLVEHSSFDDCLAQIDLVCRSYRGL